MPFPNADRVIYRKNPLERVICQMRFPSILRIDTETPAAFQDRIRESYPEFHEKEDLPILVPGSIQKEVPTELLRQMFPPSVKNYEFSSADGEWHVNLTRTFIALTAMKYERWEDFKERLVGPRQALCDIYKPAYFSRIGLRYIDIIKRSELGLTNVAWDRLVQPSVLGLLGDDAVKGCIRSHETRNDILLSDGKSIARILTSLVEWRENNNETCFKIDTDFSNEQKTDAHDVVDKLEYLHERATRLIRWAITEQLHTAMDPQMI